MNTKLTLTRFTSFLLATVVSLCLSSCNEDDDIAQTLDGIWEGEVATEYFSHRWGVQTDYQMVDIEFFSDPYRYAKGTGVEYDYSYNGRYYVECGFDFEVYNGIIYLYYDDGSNIAIRNYHLSNNHFRGEFINSDTRQYLASFDFVKVTDWRHLRYTRSDGLQFKKVPSPRLQNK